MRINLFLEIFSTNASERFSLSLYAIPYFVDSSAPTGFG